MMKKAMLTAAVVTPVLAVSLFAAYGFRNSGTSDTSNTSDKDQAISVFQEREANDDYAAVEWPNNRETQQIPKPPFDVVGENMIVEVVGNQTIEKATRVCFADVLNQDIKTYVEKKIKSAGFSGTAIEDNSLSYYWQGKNDEQLSIDIDWKKDGKTFITFYRD
ncbi:hypothetical protein FACS1894193_13760 [Bacilli bacterium]|nr:hypothetical protein FACS1894193_13760 [Bacilli bacterium]